MERLYSHSVFVLRWVAWSPNEKPSGCITFPPQIFGKVMQPLGPHRSTKTEWLYSLSISPWKGHTATRLLYFGGWLQGQARESKGKQGKSKGKQGKARKSKGKQGKARKSKERRGTARGSKRKQGKIKGKARESKGKARERQGRAWESDVQAKESKG